MRGSLVDTNHLYRQIRPLCLNDEEADFLCLDTALRFLLEYPSDALYCPGVATEDISNVHDLRVLADGSQPLRTTIYTPDPGGTSWQLAWSAAAEGVHGLKLRSAERLACQGIPRDVVAKLLRKYGDLDSMMADLATIKPKKYWGPIADATVADDVVDPVILPTRELLVSPIRDAYKEAICARMAAVASTGYKLVNTTQAYEAMLADLWECDRLAVDTETSSLDTLTLDIVGISLSGRLGEAYYIPVGHVTGELQLPMDHVATGLIPLLDSKEIAFHNFGFDARVLRRGQVWAWDLDIFDTQLAAYVTGMGTTSERDSLLSLKRLVNFLLGIKMQNIDELIGARKDRRIPFSEVPIETATMYACDDAARTWQLVPPLKARLTENDCWDIYELDKKFIRLVCKLEDNGVAIDVGAITDIAAAIATDLYEARSRVIHHAGVDFQLDSPQEMAKILYGKLGLRAGKPNLTGFSTDAEHLKSLLGRHPIVQAVLDYRGLSKLQSTYTENLTRYLHPDTGRLHSSWNAMATASGRLSSSAGPRGGLNLQNIPARTELGQAIRRAFVARNEQWTLVGGDLGQAEIRLIAHLSEDPRMISDLLSGDDFHQLTAARMFRVAPEEVTSGQRSYGKNANFSVAYLITAQGFASRYQVDVELAQEIIDLYYQTYPRVREWQNDIISTARRLGYVETIYGRRRWLTDLNHGSPKIREDEERAGVNHPVQGSVADIVKHGMLEMDTALDKLGWSESVLPILQIHDEVIFESRVEVADRVANMMSTIFPNVVSLRVPLIMDAHVGQNWGDLKAG